MKRFLSILFIISCLFTLVTPALAENTVTVHFYIPDETVIPYLWAWNDNNYVNAFDSWPGKVFNKVGDWWTCQMPADCNAIVINNRYDHQTTDIFFEAGNDIWVIADYNWQSNIYFAEPEIPHGFLEELYIVGEGIPGVNNWDASDPDGLMEENDGLYSISFELSKGSNVSFKFCGNGSLDSGYIYGAVFNDFEVSSNTNFYLTSQGYNFTYTATNNCILTVNVNLSTSVLSLQEQVLSTPTSYKTIHVRLSNDQIPTLYAWNAEDTLSSWPGIEMTDDGDWYSCRIPSEYDSIIVVGSDTEYTDAIELSDYDGEYWVVCDSDWNYTLYREMPTLTDEDIFDQYSTAMLYVYAPDAQKLSVMFSEMFDGTTFAFNMEKSDWEGWWQCEVFTDVMFGIYYEKDNRTELILTIPSVQNDLWVVLDENGEYTLYDEAPDNFKITSNKKQHKLESSEVANEPTVMIYVLIGVGVVALAGIATVVVLILRKKRS